VLKLGDQIAEHYAIFARRTPETNDVGRATVRQTIQKTTPKETAMDQAAFTEVMRALGNRTPFRPFTVALVNGDRYEIDHPETLALGTGMAVFIASDNVPVFSESEGVSQVIGDLSGRSAETSWEKLDEILSIPASQVCGGLLTHFMPVQYVAGRAREWNFDLI
jgi:hypothetical protein